MFLHVWAKGSLKIHSFIYTIHGTLWGDDVIKSPCAKAYPVSFDNYHNEYNNTMMDSMLLQNITIWLFVFHTDQLNRKKENGRGGVKLKAPIKWTHTQKQT